MSPAFLAVVVVTLVGGLLAWVAPNEVVARVGAVLLVLGGWVVFLCLHEFAHAVTAVCGGDHSVRARGYLSLNPLAYTHPVLSIVLPLLVIAAGGLGLPGGAVQIHQHALRSPRWRTAVSLAGPATNVAAGLVLAAAVGQLADGAHVAFWAGLGLLAFLQLATALLNLLPIPGLDGWGALEPHLPRRWVARGASVAPFSVVVLLALFLLTPAGAALSAVAGAAAELAGVSPWWWQTGWQLLRFWH